MAAVSTTIDHGFDGSLKLLTGGTCTCTGDKISISGGTCSTIGEMNQFDMTVSKAMLSANKLGDRFDKKVPGFASGNFSASGQSDLKDAQQKALWDLILNVSSDTAKVFRYSGTKTKGTLKGYVNQAGTGLGGGALGTFNFTVELTHFPTVCAVT